MQLNAADLEPLMARLVTANGIFLRQYPGLHVDRQPVHTLYGGAHLYKPGASVKLARLAQRHFETYAANFVEMAKALALPEAVDLPDDDGEIQTLLASSAGYGSLAARVYERVKLKLQQEAIEDQRVDFEDGYGVRADSEEDQHAISAAQTMAGEMDSGTLPAFTGIRIKALSEEARVRAIRTLDLFVSNLAASCQGKFPQPFYVTLPKVTSAEQVAVLSAALDLLESRCAIPTGSLKIELMVETVQSVFDPSGACGIPALVRAGNGRVSSAILGTFDYTASCNVASTYQDHRHPSADFARQMMQVSLTGTVVTLCDGITNIMPIPPHRGEHLSAAQQLENRQVVHEAWRVHFTNVTHSLILGFYQSWDLNPAQLPVRYAAVYHFFLSGLTDASARLQTFIDQAAQASMVGNTFDDAASAQGLLNFFISGIACGALTEAEALATGITLDELHGRSFLKIVENRLTKVDT